MARLLIVMLCLVSLGGCFYIPDYALTPNAPPPAPSAQPTAIDVRTLVPQPTAINILTPAPGATAAPPTNTAVIPSAAPSPTLTPIPPPTVTNSPPPTSTPTRSWTLAPTLVLGKMNVLLLGCKTDFDFSHGLGEVTNIYTTIQNPGGPDLSSIVATASASDEGKPHPDKTRSVQNLPANWEITFKLTVDTTFKQGTTISIAVTSQQGVTGSVSTSDCKGLDLIAESQIQQLISQGAHPILK